jgi:hypothetical protein
MIGDFNFIIIAISDALKDILQRNEEKQETRYERIEVEIIGVQKALHSSHIVSTMPPPLEETKLVYEPTQLFTIANAAKARLHHVQEEKEQATMVLNQAQEEFIEKR